MSDLALFDLYATRVLGAQDVRNGSVYMNRASAPNPVPPEHVAAVLHALADHTHIEHMLHIAREHRLQRAGDGDFAPESLSLGRYFHALADNIETNLYQQEQNSE